MHANTLPTPVRQAASRAIGQQPWQDFTQLTPREWARLKWRWLEQVARDPELSRGTYRLSVVLVTVFLNNKTRFAFQSHNAWAEAIGADPRSAMRAGTELESRGHLVVVKSVGRHNEYQLNLKDQTTEASLTPDNLVTGDCVVPTSPTSDNLVTPPLTTLSETSDTMCHPLICKPVDNLSIEPAEWRAKPKRGGQPKKTPRPIGHLCPEDFRPSDKHYLAGEKYGLSHQEVDDVCAQMYRWSNEHEDWKTAKKTRWDLALYDFMERSNKRPAPRKKPSPTDGII